MSLFDIVAPSVDTVSTQAGSSVFEDLGMAATAGLTGAVISGFGSIYNTFASGANALGADVEKIDTYRKLQELDTGWAEYYKGNQNAIDTVGFVGTSFIPGTVGIKALNAARAGEATGAVGRALGFAQTQQAKYVGRALEELAAEGGSVFTQINKNKLAAMAWGAADQTLTAAAFETAVALTMKQSPLLADDSWWDVAKTGMVGAAFGGLIGGGIDALILNKSFKNAVGALDSKLRNYDSIMNLDKLGLDKGDKAFSLVDSLLALPEKVAAQDTYLDLAFHIARPDKVPGWSAPLSASTNRVNISKLLENTLSGTEKRALLKFEETLQDLAPSKDVAGPWAEKVLKDFTSLRASGASAEEVRDRMGDWLYELKGIRAANEGPAVSGDDLLYFRKRLSTEDLTKIKTVQDYESAVISKAPFDKNAYDKPYIFTGTAKERAATFENLAQIGVEGPNGYPTLRAAWNNGHDIAMTPDGAFRVNPESKLWKKVEDPVYSSNRYVNLRTGSMTEDTVLTAADRAVAGTGLEIKNGVVRVQVAKGEFQSWTMGAKLPARDSELTAEYLTARHAWAASLADEAIPKAVSVNDFSLMDRLRSIKDPDVRSSIKLLRPDGSDLGRLDQMSLTDVIRSAKLSESQRLLAEAFEAGHTLDTRYLGYRLNADPQWLENAVAVRFRENLAGISGDAGKTVDMNTGLSLPLDSYLRRENVIAEYARPQQFKELDTLSENMSWRDKRLAIMDQVDRVGGQFVTGELAFRYRIQAAVEANKNAASAVLGADKVSQLLALDQSAAKLANSVGSGATMFGSSNADYGDLLRLWAQDTGKKAHLWIQQAVSNAMDRIGPSALKLKLDRPAAAEVGIITNILRGSDDKFVWDVVKPNRMLNKELQGKVGEEFNSILQDIESQGRRAYIDVQSDTAADFLKAHSAMNSQRVQQRQVLMSARGMTTNYAPDVIYVPPIDTTYFQHFAFVRPVEGKAFSTSEVAMVFGRDAAELQKRIALVDKANFQVITKKGTEDWFRAKDLYDFDRTINTPRINSELRRSGALTNQFPEVRAESIAEDFIRWHQNQEGRLVRDAIETHYAQQFEEIRDLGKSYTEIATSKFAGTSRASSTEVVNPYDDYLKTALDVSKRSEYKFLHQANEFVDALGVRAYQALSSAFSDGKKGLIPWQEVNAIAEKHGIKGMYSSDLEYFTSNVPRDRNLIKEGIAKANMLLANTVLRLDFFNSIVNTVSTPLTLGTELASIRTALKGNPELLGKLGEALTIKVPGAGKLVDPTPPVQAGMRRLYHGGVDLSGPGERRWLSDDLKYAEGYAAKSGDAGKVFYTDIPEDSPFLMKAFDDTGSSVKSPIAAFEADEGITASLKEFNPKQEPVMMQQRVPSALKLQAQAITNFFGPEKETLLARYKANGDIKDTLDQFHSMMDSLALRGDYKVFSDGVTKAFEKGARITLNEQAEQFTRFVSADVMRQLTDPAVKAGTLSLKEQNAYISVFVNRVQGNYITSQRPIVFQGVLGSAVSLFQTYSFNLMQQLLRHVGNKDTRAVATMFGLQAGLFGLNGTPFFEAVNTHLIGNAATNPQHRDLYSAAPQIFGKELGDWLMYGTASAMPLIMNGNMPALYTRGDINPRHMTILPINPLDIPAIQASTKLVSNLANMGSNLAGGAAIGPTLLQGLEHNGINRPLAGFAQVLAGQSTTSKGSLISASNDFSLVATSARVLGSRPMDEAIALNNLYRMKAYQAADRDRQEQLGEKVKSYLYKNQMPPDDVLEGFMKDYAKAGGRTENFNAAMQRWMKDANTSVVEKMRSKLNTSYGQRLNEIMGGTPLPDYNHVPPEELQPQVE